MDLMYTITVGEKALVFQFVMKVSLVVTFFAAMPVGIAEANNTKENYLILVDGHKRHHPPKHRNHNRYDDRYHDDRHFRDRHPRDRGFDDHQSRNRYGRGRCGRIAQRIESSDFEALKYIASYADLAKKFGSNPHLGRAHFHKHGCHEGRVIRFDPVQYVAGYSDLARRIGLHHHKAVAHYLHRGVKEGRHIDRFCGRAYAAVFKDVKARHGFNERALAVHFIKFGVREGRGQKHGRKFQRKC